MNDVDESYFDWSDEDDIICSSKYISSDEDDEDDLDATIRAHRKFAKRGGSVFGCQQKQKHQHIEEEEDDFEKEMASELTQTMEHLTSSLGMPGSSSSTKPKSKETKEAPEFYDDIYFDSDESDPEEANPGQASVKAGPKNRRRHKVLTNDELFYDPKMDDRDQEWVDQQRRSYQPRGRRPGRTLGVENNNTIQLPPTDAVLNCPACLTTLCMDCQRHEVYNNQYRAMFVFNCVVDVTERLSYPSKDQKKRKFLKSKKSKNKNHQPQEKEEDTKTEQEGMEAAAAASTGEPSVRAAEAQSNQPTNSTSDSAGASSATHPDSGSVVLGSDMFHPVMCKICNTKVAVYDSDEIYHFFNVVTSY